DRSVRLWEVDREGKTPGRLGKELQRFEGLPGGVTGLAWLPDGRRFVVGAGQQVQVWDVEQGKQLRAMQAHPGGVTSVAVSPAGKRSLASGQGGSVRLWDVETGRELKHLAGHRNWVWSAVFTPDGRHALTAGGGTNDGTGAVAGSDFTIRMWDLAP